MHHIKNREWSCSSILTKAIPVAPLQLSSTWQPIVFLIVLALKISLQYEHIHWILVKKREYCKIRSTILLTTEENSPTEIEPFSQLAQLRESIWFLQILNLLSLWSESTQLITNN